jgi:hypothetical protein
MDLKLSIKKNESFMFIRRSMSDDKNNGASLSILNPNAEVTDRQTEWETSLSSPSVEVNQSRYTRSNSTLRTSHRICDGGSGKRQNLPSYGQYKSNIVYVFDEFHYFTNLGISGILCVRRRESQYIPKELLITVSTLQV